MKDLVDKIKKEAVKATIKSQQFKSDYIEAKNSKNKNVKKARFGVVLFFVGVALIILSIFLSLK